MIFTGKTKITRTKPTDGLWSDRKFQWLIFSVAVVAVFEIFSLIGWELPQLVAFPFFAMIILAIGWRVIWNGLRALARLNFRSINLLMLIAAVGAFYLGQYEEAAVVIVLFALGERLEVYGIQTSKSALRDLVDRTPKSVTIKRDGENQLVRLEDIKIGDALVIKPSEMIAMDAEVVGGTSSIDESTITGEPIPKDKRKGSLIFAGTLNMHGYLEARVTKLVADSTLAKIVDTTFKATRSKAKTQKFIETFSGYYTPSIMLIAFLLVAIPVLLLGEPFEPWFLEALTLLVIACPCALVISTPISIYSAVGNASRRGVLIKGGKYVEALGRIRALAMDKTRTLTHGKPVVTDVIPFGDNTREHLLACVGGIQVFSEHPFAQAITNAALSENLSLHRAENFEAIHGKGVKADCVVCYDKHHCIGKLPFITEEHLVRDEIVRRVERLQAEGKTSVVATSDSEVEGIIALADELKDQSAATVAELKALGIVPVMLTGDNHGPADTIAGEAGIARVLAELLPEDKSNAVRELLKEFGDVGMVGDGVNDAPALATSTVGISMGAAGSDTAIEASDVAILNDRLELLPYLIRLGRKTISTIRFNTFLAIIVKSVFVVLAIFGMSHLALAILADVGVTILVILISLRLLSFEKHIPVNPVSQLS
ncbi:MAG: cation-translocating P-type ATPase [Acidobacteriota bacterium]|nr:cation-translocating P-type ATPase [Acidobacteriota bacterium]